MTKGYHDFICLHRFLFIFFVINLSKSFEFKCPSSKQWILRANSRCSIADGYICLFDENKNEYAEICRNKSYIYEAGYKFVIAGNPDHRKCESTRYQPLTFLTNGGSTCIFEKTYCGAEGLIIFSNGSSGSDRQCRCDNTRGYDFITKPKNSCYCVPAIEDCSCYQKPCPPGYIISPDYQCINLTSWNSQLTCRLIPSYKPRDNNQPLNEKVLDDRTASLDRNMRSLLSIMIGVTLIVTLIIAKTNVLRENVIPQNIKDLQQNEKKQWKGQFMHFVETTASNAIMEKIKEEQCLIICGPHGCGKSSLVFHTALKLDKTLGFDVMIISNPDDLLKYASKDRKQLFLIDDVFGKYSVTEYDTMWWNRQGKSVQYLLTRNRNLRLLMTSRLHIYRSVNLEHMKVKFCPFNLISQELALTFKERTNIGICYLMEDVIVNLNENVVLYYNFFPALCSIFSKNEQSNVVEYFTNPVEYIKIEIENLKKPRNQFYLALAVLIVCDNSVKKENNHTNDEMLKFLSNEIGYDKKLNKQLIFLCLTALTDSYISENDSSFECLHVDLFNVLAFCIGPSIMHSILRYGTTAFIISKMQLKTSCLHYPKFTIMIPNSLQDNYCERMLLDMKTALHNIFKGSQHLSAEFRELYIAYMKKHLKKGDLRKDIDATTVLHFVSSEGYADYVEYFLELDKKMVKELDNTGQTALHKTCIKGHLHVASLLLDNGTYIDQSDNDTKTALDIACECGLSDMADLLLTRHATIRQKIIDCRSPLHVACKEMNIKIAELLLENKADVNEKDYYGYSPLHLACEKGSIEIATMLIIHKAIIDIVDSKGETSLYTACKNGNVKVAELLLRNKANANKGNLNQNTPILIACAKNHIEIIRLLLRYKAGVNCKNRALLTPLHVACRNRNMDIILLLIKHDALVNELDRHFETPLFIACSEGYHIVNGASITTTNDNDETPLHVDDNERNVETVKVLLNAGSNVNQGNTNGITPIHLACKAQREEIVKLLINAGADVNQGDMNGITPFAMALEGRRSKNISLLLNANVNVIEGDKHSTPPLHMACKNGSEAIVKTLLNAGANVNEMDKDGLTPLHVSCKGGHEKIVTMLINAGVNVNKGDKNGETPLHMACIEGNKAIVKVFVNLNANINMKDKDGMTPLDIACRHGHNHIVTLLLNADAKWNRGDKNEITTLHIANKDEKEVTTNEVSNLNVDEYKDWYIL